MTLTECLMGGLQANQAEIISMMGTKTTQSMQNGNTCSNFDKILDSRLRSNRGGDYTAVDKYNSSTNHRDVGAEAVKMDAQPRYRTFREANNCSETTGPMVKNTASKNAEYTSRLEKDARASVKLKEEAETENIIQIMAHMLGLNVVDLRIVLDDAGVDLELLYPMQSTGEISEALSQHLGLTGEQQDALESMLNLAWQLFEIPVDQDTAAEIPDEISPALAENLQLPPDTYEAKASELPGDATLFNTFPRMTDESPLDQLSTQIILKLNEYAKLLEEDSESAEKELAKLLLPLLEKSSMRGQMLASPKQGTDDLDLLPAETNMTEASVEGAEKNMRTESCDETSQEMKFPKDQLQQVLPKTPLISDESQLQPAFSAFTQAIQVASEINTESYATTTAKEILSQIIGEAQVILSEGKSEMIMDLKPESLGKLSLKLITEKGIVMAKFVAENQQVMQVLESNMQLLKDSLQKQGLAVADFTVSVRQESASFSENKRQYGGENRHIKLSVRKSLAVETQFPDFPQATSTGNPYIWESSTINLTA